MPVNGSMIFSLEFIFLSYLSCCCYYCCWLFEFFLLLTKKSTAILFFSIFLSKANILKQKKSEKYKKTDIKTNSTYKQLNYPFYHQLVFYFNFSCCSSNCCYYDCGVKYLVCYKILYPFTYREMKNKWDIHIFFVCQN